MDRTTSPSSPLRHISKENIPSSPPQRGHDDKFQKLAAAIADMGIGGTNLEKPEDLIESFVKVMKVVSCLERHPLALLSGVARAAVRCAR